MLRFLSNPRSPWQMARSMAPEYVSDVLCGSKVLVVESDA